MGPFQPANHLFNNTMHIVEAYDHQPANLGFLPNSLFYIYRSVFGRVIEEIVMATASAFDRVELHRRRREEVVRTAAQAFSQNGFANTSMGEVAATLGISKATLYQYFKSKQEILYECHLVSMDHGEAGLAMAAAHDGDGLEKFLVYLRRYMQGAFGELGNLAMLTDVNSLSPDSRKTVVQRRAKISHATDSLIAAGIEDGSIRGGDPKTGKLFAMGVINWIPAWFIPDGPYSADELVDGFIDLFLHGFDARPSKPD